MPNHDPRPTRSVPGARAPRRIGATPLALAVLLAIVPATACAPRTGAAPGAAEPAVQTTVRVRNQSFNDVNVYALRSGQRVRLGTVNGNTTQVLRIQSFLVTGSSSLRFLADPIGSNRTPVSTEIVVNEGDQVELTVPPT
jgi:hypothetical protein